MGQTDVGRAGGKEKKCTTCVMCVVQSNKPIVRAFKIVMIAREVPKTTFF